MVIRHIRGDDGLAMDIHSPRGGRNSCMLLYYARAWCSIPPDPSLSIFPCRSVSLIYQLVTRPPRFQSLRTVFFKILVPFRKFVVSIGLLSGSIETLERTLHVVRISHNLIVIGGSLCRIQCADFEEGERVEQGTENSPHISVSAQISML